MITSSVVVSRGALIDAGLFDERFSRCEDFDLWLRMAFRGIGMDYCSNPTLYHRVSPDGLSSNRYLMKRALIDVYNKIASTLPLSRSQQTLVQECIRRAETASQLDLLKQHLASAEYALALEAADRAQTRVRSHKLNLAIVGLRCAPRVVRRLYQGYERWLRNLAVGLGNAPGSERVLAALRSRAQDLSPLVREHVAWALERHGAAPLL